MTRKIFPCICAGLMLLGASCSDSSDISGRWKQLAPAPAGLHDATGTAQMTIDFENGQNAADGSVTLTGEYVIDSPASFRAVAVAHGTWTHDVDDQDDLLLSFDYSGIDLTIVPSDSVTQPWREAVERDFRATMSRYSVVKDIELRDDGRAMSLELQSPEEDIRFIRANP